MIIFYDELEKPNEILLADAGETFPKLLVPKVASFEGGFRSNWGKILRAKEHWTLHTESAKISSLW